MITKFDFEEIENIVDSLNMTIEDQEEGETKLPRVTQIISKMIEEEALLKWANSLGFKGLDYKETLEFYANIGSKTHKGIECYLNKDFIPKDTPYSPFIAFLNWWTLLNSKFKVEILGKEERLSNKYYTGAYDLLLRINDKIFLIDFKTSKFITYKHFIQTAAYAELLKEKDINIDGTIILQLSRNEISYSEYICDFSISEQKEYFEMCKKTFFSLLHSYYCINNLEKEMKTNDWNKSIYNTK